VPKSVGVVEGDFKHFRSSEQHAGDRIRLATYDFLLAFYGDFTAVGRGVTIKVRITIIPKKKTTTKMNVARYW